MERGRLQDTAHAVLNAAAELVQEGTPFSANSRSMGVLNGANIHFLQAQEKHFADLCGVARIAFPDTSLEVIQLVWPDGDGKFPWDTGYALPPNVQQVLNV